MTMMVSCFGWFSYYNMDGDFTSVIQWIEVSWLCGEHRKESGCVMERQYGVMHSAIGLSRLWRNIAGYPSKCKADSVCPQWFSDLVEMSGSSATYSATSSGLIRQMNGQRQDHHAQHNKKNMMTCAFQMPLHYPRYKKDDYEKMPEWKLDCLLKEYGLPLAHHTDVDQKRKFAMGAFLWA